MERIRARETQIWQNQLRFHRSIIAKCPTYHKIMLWWATVGCHLQKKMSLNWNLITNYHQRFPMTLSGIFSFWSSLPIHRIPRNCWTCQYNRHQIQLHSLFTHHNDKAPGSSPLRPTTASAAGKYNHGAGSTSSIEISFGERSSRDRHESLPGKARRPTTAAPSIRDQGRNVPERSMKAGRRKTGANFNIISGAYMWRVNYALSQWLICSLVKKVPTETDV